MNSPNKNILSGETFGGLFVIEQRGVDKMGSALWLCRCNCGKEKIIKGANIVRGATKSCGCRLISLIGKRYGRLIVKSETARKELVSGRRIKQYVCECDCGNSVIRTRDSLNAKPTKIQSCGCYMKEFLKTDWGFKSHSLSTSKIYPIWSSMKKRCYNHNDPNYRFYGAKGIIVCDRWKNSFENFHEDMWDTFKEGLSLDRYPNQKGNYEPSNCRWATDIEQNRNLSSNRFVTCLGVKKCVGEWAELLGVKYCKIANRLRYNWSEEEAILGKLESERIYNYLKIKDVL